MPYLPKHLFSCFHNSYIYILFRFLQPSQSRFTSAPYVSLSHSFLSTAFFPHHLLHFMFLPSNPTFCLSPPMLLVHFLPFTETVSHQLHFSLCLSKHTKLQIKVAYFCFFLRNWKPGKTNLILVFSTSSYLSSKTST